MSGGRPTGMRALVLGVSLLVAASAVQAGWVVTLDSGKRIAADSYWEEGDEMHIETGGVALTVPRAHVRGVQKAADRRRPIDLRKMLPVDGTRAGIGAVAPSQIDRKALAKREDKLARRLLRRNRERFHAKLRGEDPAEVERLLARLRKASRKYMAVQRVLHDEPVRVAAQP